MILCAYAIVIIFTIISLLGCFCYLNNVTAQFTTYGVDFYFGIFPFNKVELAVTTLSTFQVEFTIETGTGWNYTHNVSAYSPAFVELPNNIKVYGGKYSWRYKGIHVYSDIPISVVVIYVRPYEFKTISFYNAEFLVYPYINFAIKQYKYYIASIESCFKSNSLFLLVGNEDDTTISIVPTQIIEVPKDPQYFNSSTVIVKAGETYTFLLHKTQTFLFESDNDLSGTAVVSNNPLTVISGHVYGVISREQWWLNILRNHKLNINSRCSSVVEQIPPTVTWGKQFLFVPFPHTPHVTKVIASERETTVKQTCNGTLDKIMFLAFEGEWNLTYFKNNSHVYCVIESDKPILVLQLVSEGYIQNDWRNGSFVNEVLSIVPPVEQYINAVTYIPLNTSYNEVQGHWYDDLYVHITTTSKTDILLDDKPYNWSWQSIHSENGDIIGYGTVHKFNDRLSHVLRHTDITAGLSVIGYGNVNKFYYYYYYYYYEGYTYLTGMKLNNISKG